MLIELVEAYSCPVLSNAVYVNLCSMASDLGVKIGEFCTSFVVSEMIIKQGEKLLYMLASHLSLS